MNEDRYSCLLIWIIFIVVIYTLVTTITKAIRFEQNKNIAIKLINQHAGLKELYCIYNEDNIINDHELKQLINEANNAGR